MHLEMKPGERGMSQMRERVARGARQVGAAKDLPQTDPLSPEFRDVDEYVDDIKERVQRVQESGDPTYRKTQEEMRKVSDRDLKKELTKRKLAALKASDARKAQIDKERKAIEDEILNRKKIKRALKNKQRQKKKVDKMLGDRIGKDKALDVAKKHLKKNNNYDYYHELLMAKAVE